MHRGHLVKLKGFSKKAFLDYYGRNRLVQVDDGGRPARLILVGALDSPTLVDEIADFIRLASDFKEALRESGVSPASRHRARPAWASRFDPEAEEVSARDALPPTVVGRVHARVVNELARQVASMGHSVANDQARDLFIAGAAGPRVLFELKTSNTRTDVYTAIGQLQFHGGDGCRLVAVLPAGTDSTIAARLEVLGVHLVEWKLTHDGVTFHGLEGVLDP